MGRDLNKVQLTGHLGADPDMRYTPQGSAITTFRVASGRQWRDRQGGRGETTEWFRIVAWDKLGEICNQYLAKGTRVYIEGRLQTRTYTDRDGHERSVVEVVASDMIILSARGARVSDDGPDADADDAIVPDEPAPPTAPRAPARAQPRASAPNAPRNQPQPLEEDGDVPF